MSDQSINLPAILDLSFDKLNQVTTALGVERDIIASDDEIQEAWSQLPRLLSKLPRNAISEQHVRMCVAVASGLFDSAINYAWNTAITSLRQRIRTFGLPVANQILNKSMDEQALAELKDVELLDICLKLNLMSKEAHLYLNQCREVRNSFSTAHPPTGSVDAAEFVVFQSRCGKYALIATENARGVDSQALIAAAKGSRFTTEQCAEWVKRLSETHDEQRVVLIPMLHGIYCDPASTQDARLNCLDICTVMANSLSSNVVSELVDRHSDYIARGIADRLRASSVLFKKIGRIGLLTEAERHSLLSHACKQLFSAHQDWNNFYTEPPFAARLRLLAIQAGRPASVQEEYVHTVVACGIGNSYGYSRAAYMDYLAMVRNFSPAEVAILMRLPNDGSIVANRIQAFPRCRNNFGELIRLIDANSVPVSARQEYEHWSKS